MTGGVPCADAGGPTASNPSPHQSGILLFSQIHENTLIHQKYVLDESKKIKEVLGGATVKTFVRYTLGG